MTKIFLKTRFSIKSQFSWRSAPPRMFRPDHSGRGRCRGHGHGHGYGQIYKINNPGGGRGEGGRGGCEVLHYSNIKKWSHIMFCLHSSTHSDALHPWKVKICPQDHHQKIWLEELRRIYPLLRIDSSDYWSSCYLFHGFLGHFLVTFFLFWHIFGPVWPSPALISIPDRHP